MDNKFIYILGPNAEKNERFVGTHLSEELNQIPGLIKMSTEKMHPVDSITTYVIYDGHEDWLFEYSDKKEHAVLVEGF